MTISDIYNKIRWILMVNFKIEDRVNYYNADLNKDLGLEPWDINLLLYLVESNFNVRIKNGTEKELLRLDQIVSMVYAEKTSSKKLKQIA
jgi:hypothetical protein